MGARHQARHLAQFELRTQSDRQASSGDAGEWHVSSEQKLSLVISTLGRTTELLRLFDSIEGQTVQPLDVIVVDQNSDDRLRAMLTERRRPFSVEIVHTPTDRGLSRGRNVGWRRAQGSVVLFPDDDCWYPPRLFERALETFQSRGVDIVAGRAGDENGRPINGRFESRAQAIRRANVWTTQIEWMVFFRRDVLESVRGFDEQIGVGAATPWQACEGQDIMLRALASGAKAYFDPALYGHHAELDIYSPSEAMRRKGRMYGRGLGYVLRKHRFSPALAAYWAARPLAVGAINLARLKPDRARYYGNVALGRLEGFAARTIGSQ
jgi:glycosyltransferase involved in cell wall biosynthesis